MSKIYLQLSGGLGNQMFQYAFALTIASKTNKKLFIETNSNLHDRYNRKLALDKKITKKHKLNSFFEIFIIFIIFKLEMFLKKYFDKKFITVRPWGVFFDDRYKPSYYNNFVEINTKRNIFILGYFQSEKYFKNYKNKIIKLFKIKKSFNNDYQKYKKIILKKNSVAICIRLYEEIIQSKKKTVGGVENIKFYNNSIKQIYGKIKDPFFLIFCSYNSNFIKKLKFKSQKDFLILAGKKNLENPLSTINLISLCKHHIISNSSLYFWGSYLSKNNGIKIISKKFVNKEIF